LLRPCEQIRRVLAALTSPFNRHIAVVFRR
jgi:hypothetical protein